MILTTHPQSNRAIFRSCSATQHTDRVGEFAVFCILHTALATYGAVLLLLHRHNCNFPFRFRFLCIARATTEVTDISNSLSRYPAESACRAEDMQQQLQNTVMSGVTRLCSTGKFVLHFAERGSYEITRWARNELEWEDK